MSSWSCTASVQICQPVTGPGALRQARRSRCPTPPHGQSWPKGGCASSAQIPSFAVEATKHPALVPQEGTGSSRLHPRIHATSGLENPALARESPPTPARPEVPRPACHAGGCGFESRRCRVSKCLQKGTLCCRLRRTFSPRGPNVGCDESPTEPRKSLQIPSLPTRAGDLFGATNAARRQ